MSTKQLSPKQPHKTHIPTDKDKRTTKGFAVQLKKDAKSSGTRELSHTHKAKLGYRSTVKVLKIREQLRTRRAQPVE